MRRILAIFQAGIRATGGNARWAAFWGALSLLLLLPAICMPAMVVANAVDGSSYYSIWTSIGLLRSRGLGFLAGVIFTFSVLFPILKLAMVLVAAAGGRRMPQGARRAIVGFTEWTSKYSMLDVYVIALLVLLIKVDQFVKMLPTTGLYLFCGAVLAGSLASGALKRAAAEWEASPELEPGPRWGRWVPLGCLLAGAGLAWGGWAILRVNLQGTVDRIALKNLTISPVPRSLERLQGLRDLVKPEHDFFSRETLRLLSDALQAAATDAGASRQTGYLRLSLANGAELKTDPQEVDMKAGPLALGFALPQRLGLGQITAIEFITRVEFAKLIPAELTEERIEASHALDWSRPWQRQWYGRLYEYQLQGAEPPGKTGGAWLLGAGILALLWGASGLVAARPSAQ